MIIGLGDFAHGTESRSERDGNNARYQDLQRFCAGGGGGRVENDHVVD